MKTKVDEFNGQDIFFDKEENCFCCGEWEDTDLKELKRILSRETKMEFKGDYFVKSFNGINKFTASKRYYSDYEDCYLIRGIEIDKYSSERQENKKEEELYPNNEYNQKLYDESEKLKRDGWKLISKGEALSNLLKK